MGEESLPQIKKSLQVVYKSGDLLLHLLNDLLTFSKNQIGQQLSLEEREFRLSDVKTQITTIFTKQVQEGKIHFGVKFIGSDTEGNTDTEKVLPALGPNGTGRLKDMWLVNFAFVPAMRFSDGQKILRGPNVERSESTQPLVLECHKINQKLGLKCHK
jgi:hypothetical protein